MAEPMLKWAGGKRSMLEEILPRLPSKSQFNRYFEPFVGGGAVFFALEPESGFINDINPRLINFYKQVKANPEQIISTNKDLDDKFEANLDDSDDKFYYNKRDEFNQLREDADSCEDPVREASLLLFLNRTCYNGLYRTNQQGEFNVPIGRKWTQTAAIEQRVRKCHRVLQKATITQQDFTYVSDVAEANDLVFFDPPYPSVRKTGSFEKYHPGGFGVDRHKQLRDLAIELNENNVYVMITNANDESADMAKENPVGALFSEGVMPSEFRKIKASGERYINSDATKRTDIGETDIIVTNFSPFEFDNQKRFDDFR
jgi:DNA adenine methylase